MPDLSREFLEEVFVEAKKTLPKWVYAVLHRSAMSRAGGRARHRDEQPNTLEKIALGEIKPGALRDMPEDELRAIWSRLHRWFTSARRRKRQVEPIVNATLAARNELKRRGLGFRETDLTAAVDELGGAAGVEKQGAPTNSRGWTTVETIDRVAAQNAKFSPTDAKYREPGEDSAKVCGTCRFFLRDAQDERGQCLVVDGAVAWFGTSDLFIGAEDEARAALLSVEKSATVPTVGPAGAAIMFVDSSPGGIEAARHESMVGPVGETFNDLYLSPLRLTRKEVVLTKAVPVLLTDGASVREPTTDEVDEWRDWLDGEIDRIGPRVIVALGEVASKALGERADFKLPHPASVRRFGDSGEVGRKIKRVRERLAEVVKQAPGDSAVKISKADPVKRIVYGVVLDPYGNNGPQEDSQLDWTSPAETEKTSHDFMAGPRTIGLQHKGKAKAVVVESWVEPYPDRAEYLKAMRGEPHRVSRRKFGDDVLHSGAWALGVKIGEDEWQLYEDGEINAFSPGGYSIKTPLDRADMPEVTFVDLVEQPAA